MSGWLAESAVSVSIESRRGLLPGDTGAAELDDGAFGYELSTSSGFESMTSRYPDLHILK